MTKIYGWEDLETIRPPLIHEGIKISDLGESPFMAAFRLDRSVPGGLKYVGNIEDIEIRIPKGMEGQLSEFYETLPGSPPERIYVRWDGSGVCFLDRNHISPEAMTYLDNGGIMWLQVNRKYSIEFRSKYVKSGSVMIESPEKGSHILGLTHLNPTHAIFAGHGKLPIPREDYESLGWPDRMCIEWDGKNEPFLEPLHFRLMKSKGPKEPEDSCVMPEEELLESGYKPSTLIHDPEREVLSDGKKFFARVPGTSRFYRRMGDHEIPGK